jgi:hypothetical protein
VKAFTVLFFDLAYSPYHYKECGFSQCSAPLQGSR